MLFHSVSALLYSVLVWFLGATREPSKGLTSRHVFTILLPCLGRRYQGSLMTMPTLLLCDGAVLRVRPRGILGSPAHLPEPFLGATRSGSVAAGAAVCRCLYRRAAPCADVLHFHFPSLSHSRIRAQAYRAVVIMDLVSGMNTKTKKSQEARAYRRIFS